MSKINTQIHSYWSRQLSELKKEGWVAVRRKTVTVIVKLLKCASDLCEVEIKIKKEKYFFKNSYRLNGFIEKDYLWGVN